MPKGISINIGLNSVDPASYGGWQGQLNACEADAKDMEKIARSKGFTPRLLLTKDATSVNVTKAISDVAQELAPGDFLFLTYSGHGGQVPDLNGIIDEPDGKDETWALFDRQLVDDELYSMWSQFQPGVRIFVLSDSCHSGTVLKRLEELRAIGETEEAKRVYEGGLPGARRLPPQVEDENYQANKATYDEIQRTHPDGERLAIGASIMLISGCQDDQLSSDGKKNGLFTATLLKIWKGGHFKGSYASFYRKILSEMPMWQQPKLSLVGNRGLGIKFRAQSPFDIAVGLEVK
jgi:metacaspase-1